MPKQLINHPIKIIKAPKNKSQRSPTASDNTPPIKGITIFGYATNNNFL